MGGWERATMEGGETENIPGIVLRPQLVVVEGSEGGWEVGGERLTRLKKP